LWLEKRWRGQGEYVARVGSGRGLLQVGWEEEEYRWDAIVILDTGMGGP